MTCPKRPAPQTRHLPPVRPDHNFDLLSDVSLRISVEVGSTSMRLADLLSLGEGGVIELDQQANDVLDIFANGTLIARARS